MIHDLRLTIDEKLASHLMLPNHPLVPYELPYLPLNRRLPHDSTMVNDGESTIDNRRGIGLRYAAPVPGHHLSSISF